MNAEKNPYTKYIIRKTLYKSNIFAVYKGFDIVKHSDIIIKCESSINNDISKNIIEHERKILEHLREIKQIPKIIDFYSEAFNKFLVFDYLGKDLEYIISKKKRFSLGFCAFFMTEALSILHNIHENSVFHCDLKPANFIFNQKENKIYLIDFSVAQTDNNVINKNKSIMVGTPKFCSSHCHDNTIYSGRDDLLSLGYVLLYFYYGYLSWEKNKMTETNTIYTLNNVKKIKNNVLAYLQKNGSPKEFIIYFNYCLSLKITDIIDYKMLYYLFVRLVKKMDYTKEKLEKETRDDTYNQVPIKI